MAAIEKHCTLLINYDKGTFSVTSIREQLQEEESESKIQGMRELLLMMLNGESMTHMIMDVIRFAFPVEDFQLKKLCYLFLESVDKTDAKGDMLPEMILVINFVQRDLAHPNEYMRAVALRFSSKLKHQQLIEPLVGPILENLNYRFTFVRRQAAACVHTIYSGFPDLLVDAPETMDKFIRDESDMSAKRNALLMLTHADVDIAVTWLVDNLERVSSFADILQMMILEVIRKSARTHSHLKGRYLRALVELLDGASAGVASEAAATLLTLTSAGSAVKAATQCFCSLLLTQSDNNIKLIILDRLEDIKKRFPSVVQGLIMDVLRALSCPNLDIRTKCVNIALDMLTPKNIDEVVQVLKKEVVQTQSNEHADKASEYRQLLVRALHQCASRFPEVASNVLMLMDFLSDSNTSSAVDVVFFVREIAECYPKLREGILEKLIFLLPSIRTSRVARSALWILGQYSTSPAAVSAAVEAVLSAVGPLPFVKLSEEGEAEIVTDTPATTTVVLADGTYSTQTAAASAVTSNLTDSQQIFRQLLISGDFYLGASISTCLTKLVERLRAQGADPAVTNQLISRSMLLMCGIIRLGHSSVSPHGIDHDSLERISLCIRVLSEPSDELANVWLAQCQESFHHKLVVADQPARSKDLPTDTVTIRQADELLSIRLLAQPGAIPDDVQAEDDSVWLGAKAATEEFSARLNRITQLTGFSDPVYAEAVVTVHEYDVVLDMMLINQTDATMQNLTLELSTVGDLKLCERPGVISLPAHASHTIKANIKVSSTETGIIFGNIVWDDKGEQSSVILNDIHMDIMDYIKPATCSELAFRSMWAEFEWENKVGINTSIMNEHDFLDHICAATNMKCLTPALAREGSCGFLAANLYAKSLFGEDALVNLSVERQASGRIGGYVRIRSKTQGIALSLGDKITMKQMAIKA
jgi:coatomer subunit beta